MKHFKEISLLLNLLMHNLKIQRFIGRLFAIWPLDEKAKNWEIYVNECIWYFFHLNLWLLILPIFTAAYKERFKLLSIVSSINQLLLISETLFLMILFKLARLRFRVLLQNSNEFFTFMKKRIFLLHKFAKFTKMYLFILHFTGVICLLVVFIFVYRSIAVKPLRFPTNAYYPFSFNSSIIWNLFYIHQITSIYYVTVNIFIDSIIILLFFTSAMKLKLLQIEFQNVETYSDLVKCVRRHQEIIWFIQETNSVIRYIILKTIISLCCFFVSEAVKLLNSHVSSILQIQFLLLFMVGISRLYFYSYCAESITTLGVDLAFAVYCTMWHKQTQQMKISKCIIISRCQKSLNISVAGIMPSLNMRFLGRLLYLTFSYIVSFRAVTKNYE